MGDFSQKSMKISRYLLTFAALFVFCVFVSVVLADTTFVLRPIIDGGDDSASWTATGGIFCDTTDCYAEINESSGSLCTNSDGDVSYIESSVNGANQTFDIDESSIPDDSTITQIDITICAVRGRGGATIQTRRCVNGLCVNSGSRIMLSGSYVETTQSYAGLNIVKDSSTNIEVGVVNTAAKTARVSQISAVITYIPPSDTTAPADIIDLSLSNATVSSIDLSWTAPGDDGSGGVATAYDLRYSTLEITDGNWNSATQATGEPTPSVAGSGESMTTSGLFPETIYYFALKTSDEVPNESGLSNAPSLITQAVSISGATGGGFRSPDYANAFFSGYAYPHGAIEVLGRNRLDFENAITGIASTVVLDNGTFSIFADKLLYGDYLFVLRAVDKDGRESGITSFDVDFFANKGYFMATDIFIPPTLDFENALVIHGANLKILGYALPQSTIEIEVDGIIKKETEADENGHFVFFLNTTSLQLGEHSIRVKQVDVLNLGNSVISTSKIFRVSSLEYPKADLNNDNIVDITDWSVFLFWWGSDDVQERAKIDLNEDGVIDIVDFSIFLNVIKN